MKRYKMRIGYTPDSVIIRPHEDPCGEWIKYEDVMGTFHGFKYCQLKNQPPDTSCLCNCHEYGQVEMSRSCVSISWVCPDHGYKERLNVETKSKLL